MNSIAKTVVSSKLSSFSKNIGLEEDEDKGDQGTMSAKEQRKQQEKEAVEKAKREEKYAKRHAEREKKREDIRAKYGLQKDQKGQPTGRNEKAAPKQEENKDEERNCVVM